MAEAPSASWSRPGSALWPRAALVAVAGVAALVVSWSTLHVGFYQRSQIVDTPVYRGYGDAMADGAVPYRDFALEYPPGALPVFLVPSLLADDYDRAFDLLMLACAAVAVAAVAVVLAARRASMPRLLGGVLFTALAPLALGSVVLSRFDLWPAALLTVALAALVCDRDRVGFGFLALAVAAKLYAVVVLPLALVHVARKRGSRDALGGAAAFALVLAVAFVPFLVVAPDGVLASFERQAGRPLQIESLGASLLLGAHLLGIYDASVVSSHGSQNLAGSLPDALATAQVALQALAVVGVWFVFARTPGGRARLLTASAAAVAAFVAFGKVLSPQFMIWLLPLVPLVAGGVGAVAAGLLAAALVATQLWFPFRYWDVVALEPAAWLVVVRDLLLVALFAVLLMATGRVAKPGRARARSG